MDTTVTIGKYTYVVTDDGRIEILRHGKAWRTETGDNAMLALIMEVEALEGRVAKTLDDLKYANIRNSGLEKAVREARDMWLEENDPKDGTDCVTPFDGVLYRNY